MLYLPLKSGQLPALVDEAALKHRSAQEKGGPACLSLTRTLCLARLPRSPAGSASPSAWLSSEGFLKNAFSCLPGPVSLTVCLQPQIGILAGRHD